MFFKGQRKGALGANGLIIALLPVLSEDDSSDLYTAHFFMKTTNLEQRLHKN